MRRGWRSVKVLWWQRSHSRLQQVGLSVGMARFPSGGGAYLERLQVFLAARVRGRAAKGSTPDATRPRRS
jgi:hypothetical protein